MGVMRLRCCLLQGTFENLPLPTLAGLGALWSMQDVWPGSIYSAMDRSGKVGGWEWWSAKIKCPGRSNFHSSW